MPIDPLYKEKEYLRKIAENDQQAFAEIVRRYWNNLYAQALAYTKSSQLSQDIVQEVFLKIWLKRAILPDIESFEGYLFIVARNHIISAFRKKLSGPVNYELDHTLEEGTWLPDRQLVFKQLQEQVNKAIDLLPPQRRTVFRLSRQDGLNYEQIAGVLGISKNTVKEHIVKALNFLRTYLRTYGGTLLLLLLFRELAEVFF